eukprot:6935719-Pyramimonas_sp.AAC.1
MATVPAQHVHGAGGSMLRRAAVMRGHNGAERDSKGSGEGRLVIEGLLQIQHQMAALAVTRR